MIDRASPAGLARAALTVSGWNAVSRVSGFVRVLVVGAALGTTYLGNTYQSSNLVSNLLFELLAAGILSAPLVAPFVALFDQDRQAEVEALAGTLLGLCVTVLGSVALVLAIGGHQIMRVLTAGVDDPIVRAQEVRLGGFFLWFFLPQVVLYAVGAVASAVLNARRRFAAAAFAPVANNITVILTMMAFMVVHDGPVTLELDTGTRLILAVGTTLGVLAMTAVPLLALARAGVRLRPRLGLRHGELPAVLRLGAWGAVFLGSFQVLIGVTLVLANQVEGGVVAYQIAFTFFLLPVALVAHPLFTTLHPRMAAHLHAGDRDAFAEEVSSGLRRMTLLVLPAAALLAALGEPALRLVRVGALDMDGVRLVGRVLAAYALGLGGYGALQLLARAAITAGEAKLPAMVAGGFTAAGALAMVASSLAVVGDAQVVVLGLAHSLAVTAGALALMAMLRRRLNQRFAVGATVARALLAAGCVWAAAVACTRLITVRGRGGAALELAVAAPSAVTVGAVVLWLLQAPEIRGLWLRPAS